jgi:ATP-dependent Clp protease ATP-binding subunit ClpC
VIEQFTDGTRRVLLLAQKEATALNSDYVNTEHLLLGVTEEGEGIGAKALESLGISTEALRVKVAEDFPGQGTGADDPQLSEKSKLVLQLALREALHLGDNYIGTEHILLALIREGDTLALIRVGNSECARLLTSLGTNPDRVRHEVLQFRPGYQGPIDTPAGP